MDSMQLLRRGLRLGLALLPAAAEDLRVGGDVEHDDLDDGDDDGEDGDEDDDDADAEVVLARLAHPRLLARQLVRILLLLVVVLHVADGAARGRRRALLAVHRRLWHGVGSLFDLDLIYARSCRWRELSL